MSVVVLAVVFLVGLMLVVVIGPCLVLVSELVAARLVAEVGCVLIRVWGLFLVLEVVRAPFLFAGSHWFEF